jgi:hypothetical protein
MRSSRINLTKFHKIWKIFNFWRQNWVSKVFAYHKFALTRIRTLLITLKPLEKSTWNLECIFIIKIHVIINRTHNSGTNTFKVMPFSRKFCVNQICKCPITLKQFEVWTWNLEYIFTIKVFVITNMTYNSDTNICQVILPFHLHFVLTKICIWPRTLKLLEIIDWNLEYTFTIKINVITNKTHNSATNTCQVMSIYFTFWKSKYALSP